jgi:formamidopyrimidine-DNA glycosylase
MRMSGSFDVLSAATAQPDKHDRFVLTLESGKVVTFCDPRKFGRAQVVNDFEAFSAKLGIEPLSSEFTAHALAMRLGRKRALKPLLLDQTVVAGLGNIYVDEALWYSGLHPLRVAHTVTPQEIGKLRTAIVSVLKRAIAKQGTDFGDGVVEMGSYRPVVYGRKGERCRRCRGEIQRIVVGQRGTHLCPVCQPRKPKLARKG